MSTDPKPVALTPEELQVSLSLLGKTNPALSGILRRHLGLIPAEPEPATEPESPTAAIHAKLAELDHAAHAINRAALDEINAEIEHREKAEQEAAARKAEPVNLENAVAAALEPVGARACKVSPVKRRMIESSVKIRASLPEELVYQHSVFCQTVLPYRDPGPEVPEWERKQGNVLLQITAGKIADKRQQKFIPVGLPYGPAARLILTHLNRSYALTGRVEYAGPNIIR